jgi:hypothetical protein
MADDETVNSQTNSGRLPVLPETNSLVTKSEDPASLIKSHNMSPTNSVSTNSLFSLRASVMLPSNPLLDTGRLMSRQC